MTTKNVNYQLKCWKYSNTRLAVIVDGCGMHRPPATKGNVKTPSDHWRLRHACTWPPATNGNDSTKFNVTDFHGWTYFRNFTDFYTEFWSINKIIENKNSGKSNELTVLFTTLPTGSCTFIRLNAIEYNTVTHSHSVHVVYILTVIVCMQYTCNTQW